MSRIIEASNRSSGDWLPGVRNCINRAIPCGNPLCADEAMRSGAIESGAGQETHGSIQAMNHAIKIAMNCEDGGNCPLERIGLGDRETVLKIIQANHAEN